MSLGLTGCRVVFAIDHSYRARDLSARSNFRVASPARAEFHLDFWCKCRAAATTITVDISLALVIKISSRAKLEDVGMPAGALYRGLSRLFLPH